ncbi:MAG: TauD/TfdA family dioxygenase, partial [Proteobacteria bacterium]|nr:TauD/TfdA family dioxygenase [Pseudomonadota bacterium]
MKNHSHQALGALSISPASGALGAVVEGLDISKLNSAQVAAIRPLLDEYSVLVFPDQELTPEEQIAFT